MIVLRVLKSNQDGYLIPHNLANVPYTHARLYYTPFATSDYVQGVLVTGTPSFEFDESALTFDELSLTKLKVSTDGVTYTEDTSFGGTEGNRLPGTVETLDPADGDADDLVCNNADGDGIIFKPIATVLSDAGIDTGGVDYFFCRGILCQESTIDSGKAFFGGLTVDSGTGTFIQAVGTPEVTIATSFSRSLSSRVSAGIYKLQFRTGSPAVNGFVDGLDGSSFNYKFESVTYDVYNKLEIEVIIPDEQWGALRTSEYLGRAVLDVYYDNNNDYTAGRLVVKTYNAAGTLADDVIKGGITVEFKAFNNLL